MPWLPQTLPAYVERGGRQVWRPPYRAVSAQVHGFVLEADPTAIDLIAQRDLVAPSGGALDYRSAHPSVMVTVAAIDRLTSATAPDALRGYVPELELSVWCLLADQTAGDRLVWYLPYVFTDSGQTVATGREVYGYPKQVGGFDAGYPSVLGTGGSTTVSGLAIDTYGPQACATPRPMVTLTRLPGSGTSPANPPGQGLLQQVVAGLLPGGLQISTGAVVTAPGAASATITVSGGAPPVVPPVPAWVKPVVKGLQGKGLTGDPDAMIAAMVANPTLVFLKQFRDVTCSTKACYQAVVEAPIHVDAASASFTALDPALFELVVQDWDSHPIASELGLAAVGQPLTPERAFVAGFDFDVQTGIEVWRAPT